MDLELFFCRFPMATLMSLYFSAIYESNAEQHTQRSFDTVH
jgi:hypothetical protein